MTEQNKKEVLKVAYLVQMIAVITKTVHFVRLINSDSRAALLAP